MTDTELSDKNRFGATRAAPDDIQLLPDSPGNIGPGAERGRRRLGAVLVAALLLWLVGGLIANTAQTGGGNIRLQDVHFFAASGEQMYGLLYIPASATSKHPACAVDATHGYINSHDTMDAVAIEMARRGCVVLAPDQTGHGFSDGPAFSDAYGGAASLTYLRTLSFVNHSDIALVGHSMGGWSSVLAAATDPTGYRSLVLMSSSVSTPALEPVPGTPVFPRNVAVVEARYSEFSTLMWAVPKGSDFPRSTRMQAMFGSKATIVPGHVYGSVAAGTARVLYLSGTTHPGITQDPGAIAHTVSWLQRTLSGVRTTSPSNQTWYWDEIGTFLALMGVVLVIFPTSGLLLRMPMFAGLRRASVPSIGLRGAKWFLAVGVSMLTAILSFYWLMNQGPIWFPAGGIFPQTVTTGIAVWAVFGALVGALGFAVWHFSTNRRNRMALAAYGVGDDSGRVALAPIGRSLLLAIVSLVPAYLLVLLTGWAFHSDVRLWIFNIKPVDFVHFKILLSYVLPFTLYFAVLGLVLHGQLRRSGGSLAVDMIRNIMVLAGTYVIFMAVEYGTLFVTGELATSSQPLFSIVALQFIPVFVIVAALMTWFYRKTGWIWPGAFACALLVTATIVAGTATQGVPW